MARRKRKPETAMPITDALEIRHHEPEVRHHELPERLRGHADRYVWPVGKPLPTHYQRTQPLPCNVCRRVLLDSGRQAVRTCSIHKHIAYLECKACGHRWSKPIDVVKHK